MSMPIVVTLEFILLDLAALLCLVAPSKHHSIERREHGLIILLIDAAVHALLRKHAEAGLRMALNSNHHQDPSRCLPQAPSQLIAEHGSPRVLLGRTAGFPALMRMYNLARQVVMGRYAGGGCDRLPRNCVQTHRTLREKSEMPRTLHVVAAALLLASPLLGSGAFAQKSGGVLKVYFLRQPGEHVDP